MPTEPTAPVESLQISRSNSDHDGMNTAADFGRSFAVLVGGVYTQELAKEEMEILMPMTVATQVPVLHADFVHILHGTGVDPPSSLLTLVRLDPEHEESMKRESKITIEFEFAYVTDDPEVVEVKKQAFEFEVDPEAYLHDGFSYTQFLFTFGNDPSLAELKLDEITLFDVSDDSDGGFPASISIWPGATESDEKVVLPMIEQSPEIEVADYFESDIDYYDEEEKELPDDPEDPDLFKTDE